MTPLNPWLCHGYSMPTEHSDASTRLSLIRASNDRDWLCRVVAYAERQQKSVTEAAQRRLRFLAREQSRCA